ncbi:MAG: DUF885 family protein [Solobacterium sp.]|nr:DUF885 family protein [Solobacterium sp.]
MNLISKAAGVVAGVSLALTLGVPVYAQDEDQAFEEFLQDEFIEAMESDFMSMHFTVRDYRAYGIEKPDLVIGSASWDDYEEGVREGEETLANLAEFDYSKLNPEHQHDYDTFKFYVECLTELNSYPDYDWWFMPSEGLIDNLPTNFTEYVFYEKQDIDDYLEVLASVSDYIDGALDITARQVEHGVFMTDSALDQTLDAIEKFVTRTDDNPLIVIFEENVDAFAGLTEAERADYKARNRDILMNSYIPAYNRAAERLESWRGTRSDTDTIADLPGGKDYYAARIRFKASTDKDPQALMDLCTEYIEDEIDNYIDLLYSVRNESIFDETVSLSDPEEIIAFHEKNMDVYPEGPKVTYKAAYLDPAVASDGIIAYYLEPPIDEITTDNIVKINGDNVADVNELYSTLAHEGFPGHLYQITWYLNTDPSPLRAAISNIGYTEGWAMYAEDEAWSYSGLNEYAAEFDRINTSMGYAMNAAADIAVNGLGWSESRLGTWLNGIGLNAEIAPDLYDFVMDTPGVIIPYGAGLAQFMLIRDDAKSALQSQFDLTAFNEVLLTYGDRPFELVEKDVQAWIETFDPSQSVPVVPDVTPAPSRRMNPLLYAGGFAAAVILIIIGAILIRRSRKGNPFR